MGSAARGAGGAVPGVQAHVDRLAAEAGRGLGNSHPQAHQRRKEAPGSARKARVIAARPVSVRRGGAGHYPCHFVVKSDPIPSH